MNPEDLTAFVDEVATAVVDRMSGMKHDRPLYSAETLAERLAVSERTVRQLLADGHIASFRIGGVRRVDAAEVDRYLRERQADES